MSEQPITAGSAGPATTDNRPPRGGGGGDRDGRGRRDDRGGRGGGRDGGEKSQFLERGKPSRMNPSATSSSLRRSSTRALVRDAGTRSPASRYFFASSPNLVPLLMLWRKRSPVETCGIPSFSTSFSACVPLPAPGGPSRTNLTSGTLRSCAASTGSRFA